MRSIVWGDVDYPVTQPYAPATHRGIDIGMPSGTPLFAARAGRVFARGPGYFAIQVDGAAQRDWYLHIQSSIAYGFGVHLDRGEAIALSGAVPLYRHNADGTSTLIPITGPHLHFEVQTGALDVAATSLDPVPILLTGLYGSGGGTLGEDMTPQESAFLSDLHAAVGRLEVAFGTATPAGPNPAPPNYLGWSGAVTTAIATLQTAVSALPVADQAPTMAAIAKVQAKLDLHLK